MYSGQLCRNSATLVSWPTTDGGERGGQPRRAVLDLAVGDPRSPCTTAGASGMASATRSHTVAKLSYTRRLYRAGRVGDIV